MELETVSPTESLSLETAVAEFDEGQNAVVPSKHQPVEPGLIDYGLEDADFENGGSMTGALTLDDAVEEMDDDERPGRAVVPGREPIAAVVGNTPLTMTQLVNAYADRQALEQGWEVLTRQHEELISASESLFHNAWALASFMADRMPPEPDASLAYTNPGAYVAQEAVHQNAARAVAHIVEQGQEAKQAVANYSAIRDEQILISENARLLSYFPDAGHGEERVQFFDRVFDVAAYCGYSVNDVMAVKDHRLFVLADLAADGLAKRQDAPRETSRSTPRKRRRSHNTAMERLSQTGTLADALQVDFD